MPLDPARNFGRCTLKQGYNAAATTIEVEPGHGARLPNPFVDGSFNFVWWNAEDYPDPTGNFFTDGDPNVEIGRCTARVGDVLTVVRAQEGTAATDKNIATKTYQIFLGATKKLIDDIGLLYGEIAQDESVTGTWTFSPHGDGGLTNYDILIGNGSPDYGMARIGNSAIGRTSFKSGNIDLDGAILYRNVGGPVTSEIEHVFTESVGNTCRFALPKSGVGNATYNPRSMLLAGPAPADTNFVKVGYWQTNNAIFHNLACDTGSSGSDLGVQNDLEVEGDIFTDSIKESTPEAGISINNFNIVDVGDIALDTISSAAGTSISVILGTDAGDDFIVGNNNALVVSGDTNLVGVGTNNPTEALHIMRAGTGAFLKIEAEAGRQSGFIFDGDRQYSFKMKGNESDQLVLRDDSGGVDRLTLLATGLFGINEANPAAMLEIATNSSSEEALILKGSASQSADYLQILDSSDNELVTINSNARLMIHAQEDVAIEAEREGSVCNLNMLVHSDTTSHAPNFIGKRTRGTIASPTAVTNNTRLFEMGGRGHDGTSIGNQNRAGIIMSATETWDASGNGTKILFRVTPNNTTTTISALTINNNGQTQMANFLTSVVGLRVIGSTGQSADLQQWEVNSVDQARITKDGGAVFNEQGAAAGDVRMEGDTEDKLFLLDASEDQVRMGDGDTNYSAFSSTGQLNLVGTARVIINDDVEITVPAKGLAKPPDDGEKDNFSTLDFDDGDDEEIFFEYHVRHNYSPEGLIHIHAHFFTDAVPGGADEVVEWSLQYKKVSEGEAFDFSAGTSNTTATQVLTSADTVTEIYETQALVLDTAGFQPDDHVLMRLHRNGGVGNDDYVGDARLFRIHIEYLSNKLGAAT